MIKDDFYSYLTVNKPTDLMNYAQLQSGFESLVSSYPYFSVAAACLSKILKERSHSGFDEMLSFASARVNDRKQLYFFVNNITDITIKPIKEEGSAETLEDSNLRLTDDKALESRNNETPVSVIESGNSIENSPESIKKNTEKDIIQQILSYPEIKIATKELKELSSDLLEVDDAFIVHDDTVSNRRKMGFSDWLKAIKTQVSEEQHLASNSLLEQASTDKNSLIERFIKTEPRISAPSKKEFFSPAIMAKKSIEDHDDIVTETLAQIHVHQGNIPKAIKIYGKLMLIYPEKSSYFAALIEKLNKA
jgi:hypothetical protein